MSTSTINQNMPILEMTCKVRGSKGNEYTIKRTRDGAWSCSCPSWKFQRNRAGNSRTCTHITSLAMNLGQHVVGALR